MKTILKIAAVAISLVLMLLTDIPLLPVQQVPEADAVMGVRRRTRRRSVAVGYTAGAAAATAATSQQQSATTEQQASTAAPPADAGEPLPLGTVVSSLPADCVSTPVGGVDYYKCGVNYYRAAFQGNNLVYVTVKPE
jgi:hypothetical protein